MVFLASDKISSEISTSLILKPDAAHTCAIPTPILPAPITPTFFIIFVILRVLPCIYFRTKQIFLTFYFFSSASSSGTALNKSATSP